MLLGSHDVKRLRRLLEMELGRGASPRVLLAQLEHAIAGLYSPKGHFSDRELDIAYLAKALDGMESATATANNYNTGCRTSSIAGGEKLWLTRHVLLERVLRLRSHVDLSILDVGLE